MVRCCFVTIIGGQQLFQFCDADRIRGTILRDLIVQK